jgi:hypothetical protein
VTADDVVDAARAYAGPRQTVGMVVGAVFLVAGIVAFVATRDWWWLMLSLIGAVAGASPFLRAIDRALARGNPNARIGEVCEMSFFEEGLRFEQGAVIGLIRWADVHEVREGEGAILILKDRALMASIPKRAFADAAELETALAYLRAKVPNR